MERFYSQSTGCTYLKALHATMPFDVVRIDDERFDAVIANPDPTKVRGHDAAGLPILINPPAVVLSIEQLAAIERTWRDGEVSSTEWLVTRHRDEQEMQLSTTLTAEQFAELLVYRQALRDWPQSEAFPDSSKRLQRPSWIDLYTH